MSALRYQTRSFTDLWWWVRGRKRGVGARDVALGHSRDRVPMMLALAGVVAVETAAVGLLVPWPIVHVLDALALLQILGFIATAVTRPHVLRPGELLLRSGPLIELRVPLHWVTAVRVARKDHSGRSVELTGDELALPVGNQTDVAVELSTPVAVPGTDDTATVVRFRADEPRAAADAIRSALSARADAGRENG
ncbi:hypothetical protein [Amycolatopsis sp. CA-230715]|uniref:hypothetical protein n=1 Tax=Amycolatopsis sp. CA-230715 TaxID=2745196 RepID=UPI001C028632|nr:hypothetical protein [Amycolatopsis sp. CA-230715]QWF84640.1 hypothetical protein HUW46_08091 [Amycolatopsis sp. CA-230715]